MLTEQARGNDTAAQEMRAICELFDTSAPHVMAALSITAPDPSDWLSGSDDDGNPWAVGGFTDQVVTVMFSPSGWAVHVEDHTTETEALAEVSQAQQLATEARKLIQ